MFQDGREFGEESIYRKRTARTSNFTRSYFTYPLSKAKVGTKPTLLVPNLCRYKAHNVGCCSVEWTDVRIPVIFKSLLTVHKVPRPIISECIDVGHSSHKRNKEKFQCNGKSSAPSSKIQSDKYWCQYGTKLEVNAEIPR